MTQRAALHTWYDAGCTPLPVAPDGSKRPAVNHWRQLQHHRPPLDQLQTLWNVDSDGVGIICGAASGNLEMIELEAAAIAEGLLAQLAQTFTDHDQANLWSTIAAGCVELTPSGGMHLYYRTEGPTRPNTKLASRPATDTELQQRPGNRVVVLIETRGQGGWSVVAPSTGRSHPTGGAWTAVVGGPATIPTITDEQRDTIHDLCRLLDQMPTPEPAPPPTAAPPAVAPGPADGNIRPGDDYNTRARWEDILGPHGWKVHHVTGGTTYWTRPGKNRDDGVSATTGHSDDGEDRLFVFSTAAWPFEPEIPYSKFGAYALLEHGGDHSAAASALQAAGYGTPPAERRLVLLPSDTTAPPATQTTTAARVDGTAAIAPVVNFPAQTAPQLVEDNEDALAQAFVNDVDGQLRYCPQRKQWLTWTGARWQWDEAEHHRELIKRIARRLPRIDKTDRAWRRKMLTANGVSAIARLARTDPRVVVHIEDLDAHPFELNTPAGAIDLRTGHLMPPDPHKLHTRSTSVAPDFDMPTPLWEAFLGDTFNHDTELIAFVQRLLGISVIGQALEQILPFAHGAGANGKSTLIETVMSVLGIGRDGYAIAAAAEMLMVRRNNEHPAELAQLAGARMVVCSELEDGQRFAEARIKQLTGSDSINARHMFGNPFTFRPSHTIFLVANHKPVAAVGGPAFWRRLILLPFLNVVPEEKRDPELQGKLAGEAAGILAWIARGAAEWHTGGLRIPAAVAAATEAYQRDEDTVKRFIEEQCHLALGTPDHVQVRVSEMRRAYEHMCRELGDEPVSQRRFGEELRDRWGIVSQKGAKGARFYRGVTLLQADSDDDENGAGGLL